MPQLSRWLVALTLTASIASVAVGCGGSAGPSEAEITQQRTHLTKVISKEIVRREQLKARRAAKRGEAACRAQVGQALDSLDSLYRRLTSYLTVRSYGEALDELNRSLDRIPRGSLSTRCLQVVSNIEDAVETNESTYSLLYNCAVFYTETCDVNDAGHQESVEGATELTDIYLDDASDVLKAIGRARTKPKLPSVFLPRSEASVKGTVYGVTVEYFCGMNVQQSAVQPCQTLRDVLVDGVEESEESDLNDALTGVLGAYGLVADAGSETA